MDTMNCLLFKYKVSGITPFSTIITFTRPKYKCLELVSRSNVVLLTEVSWLVMQSVMCSSCKPYELI